MKKLLVATNPHRHVDHQGRPCAACPIDPRDPAHYDPAKDRNAEVRGWVGARLKANPTLLRKGGDPKVGVSGPSPRHDNQFEFRFAPFEIHDTRFYRKRIAEGALIVASKESAQQIGVKFTPVEQVRKIAKDASRSTVEPLWIDPPPEAPEQSKEDSAAAPAGPDASGPASADPEKVADSKVSRRGIRGSKTTAPTGADDDSANQT